MHGDLQPSDEKEGAETSIGSPTNRESHKTNDGSTHDEDDDFPSPDGIDTDDECEVAGQKTTDGGQISTAESNIFPVGDNMVGHDFHGEEASSQNKVYPTLVSTEISYETSTVNQGPLTVNEVTIGSFQSNDLVQGSKREKRRRHEQGSKLKKRRSHQTKFRSNKAEQSAKPTGGAFYVNVKDLRDDHGIVKSASKGTGNFRDCLPSTIKTLCSSLGRDHDGAKSIGDMAVNDWNATMYGPSWKQVMQQERDPSMNHVNRTLQKFSLVFRTCKPQYARDPSRIFKETCGHFMFIVNFSATRKATKASVKDKHALAFISIPTAVGGASDRFLIDCQNGRKPICLEESDYTNTMTANGKTISALWNAQSCIRNYLQDNAGTEWKIRVSVDSVYILDDTRRVWPPYTDWKKLGINPGWQQRK